MMRARTIAVAVVFSAAALSACGGGSPVQRGYGSQQILQLRDTRFKFMGARGDVVLYAIGIRPDDSMYFSIDLRTGAVADHDVYYSDIPYPEYTYPSDPNARYHCSYFTGAGNVFEFRIDDGQTGQRTTISGVTDGSASRCPTESDPTVKVWRSDGASHQVLWTGPFDDLQMVPIDLAIAYPFGTFDATSTAVTVFAGQSAQPDALGIYSIDLTTFAITELVPPVLAGGAWADGAAPAGVLDSATLERYPPDSPFAVGDHFMYWRTMADGSQTLFAGPLPSGPASEVAIFTAAASAAKRTYLSSTTGATVARAVLPVWQRWADSSLSGPGDLLIWDDARERLLTCLSTFASTATGVLSDDHAKLVAFDQSTADDPTVQQSQPTGPLALIDMNGPGAGDAACTKLAASDVNVAGMAPDGSMMFWLVEAPYPATTAQLFFAAPDGSAPRLVDDDRIEGPPHAPHFVGPSQLEVDIFADLVWTDVHDDPIVSHPIADRTTGGAIDRGRWLIIGYDKSSQDGTAILGLVNRDHDDKRPISPDVATFMTPDIYDPYHDVESSPDRTASDPLRVVYLVRGHNPSAQDGLWVANIYPGDTP